MDKNKIKILSVNISEKKSVIKHPVKEIVLNTKGIAGDAHAGNWHRQVSLLGVESIEKLKKLANRKINHGEFAENITTQGVELYKTTPFDRFKIGEVELEFTQIGKKCHSDSCAIFREIGNCVMPKEGIFCRVIKTCTIIPGNMMTYFPKVFKILIITLSDRASKGEYENKSGPKIKKLTENYFKEINWKYKIENIIIPDNPKKLKSLLLNAKKNNVDVIFTTGGTGIGHRDFTTEVVNSMIDKQIPGIMELIRIKYGQKKPNALLSRGIAGVMGQSLIYALPGSVKAVDEYMSEITKTLQHLIFRLHDLDVH
jgi:molybdenum cofactor synthesis domain-containing protein